VAINRKRALAELELLSRRRRKLIKVLDLNPKRRGARKVRERWNMPMIPSVWENPKPGKPDLEGKAACKMAKQMEKEALKALLAEMRKEASKKRRRK
jgi:hypothetical protein